LIKNGSDAHLRYNLLRDSISNNYFEVSKILIENGADLKIIDDRCLYSIIDDSLSNKDIETDESIEFFFYLISKGVNKTYLSLFEKYDKINALSKISKILKKNNELYC